MKRKRLVLWSLLLLQAAPLLILIASGSGLFDPLGHFIERSVPLPPPGEPRSFITRFVVNTTRLVTFWWFMVCVWLIALGSIAAIVYVAFDRAITRLERFAWALSFVFGHPVTVILYCVLGLLSLRPQRQPSVA